MQSYVAVFYAAIDANQRLGRRGAPSPHQMTEHRLGDVGLCEGCPMASAAVKRRYSRRREGLLLANPAGAPISIALSKRSDCKPYATWRGARAQVMGKRSSRHPQAELRTSDSGMPKTILAILVRDRRAQKPFRPCSDYAVNSGSMPAKSSKILILLASPRGFEPLFPP